MSALYDWIVDLQKPFFFWISVLKKYGFGMEGTQTKTRSPLYFVVYWNWLTLPEWSNGEVLRMKPAGCTM